MNKFLTASTVILLGLSCYLGYRVFELQHTIQALKQPFERCNNLPYDYSNGDTQGIINYETARALARNYQNDKKKSKIWELDDNIVHIPSEKEDDALSVWFSLDRLKNYIWHIEQQSCLNGCNNNLGLRIYYARYPDLNNTNYEGLEGVPKTYSNHHTLFMVPTYLAEDGFNTDFYPPGKDCKTPLLASPRKIPIDPGEDPVHLPSNSYFLFDVSSGKADPQNHGGLIPPGNATGTTFLPNN